jgi:uncharacterized LabA/DUF88 family protein
MADNRVMIYVDGSNFYHNVKYHGFTTNIDFHKFSNLLCQNRTLMRTYYYNAPLAQQDNPDGYKDQQRFLDRLRRTPYLEVKLGYFLKKNKSCDGCGKTQTYLVEKGVDVNLATDMLSMAYKNLYDVAVLVSIDGDFAVACQAVKDLGKHIEVAYFPSRSSWHLLNVCDNRIQIDNGVINQCL